MFWGLWGYRFLGGDPIALQCLMQFHEFLVPSSFIIQSTLILICIGLHIRFLNIFLIFPDYFGIPDSFCIDVDLRSIAETRLLDM